jgi:hypothetical protein
MQCVKTVNWTWSWSVSGVPPRLEGGAAAAVGKSTWGTLCCGSARCVQPCIGFCSSPCQLMLGAVLFQIWVML